MLVFDIETNGLLDKLTHVKCLNIVDTSTGAKERYTDSEFYEQPWPDVFGDGQLHILKGNKTKRTGTIAEGLARLQHADEIGGHNIIGFDIPAIKKVYPTWAYTGTVWDSVVMSRVMYTNLYEMDVKALRTGRLPAAFESKKLVGTHKLESWGLRLGGELKGDFLPSHFGQTWDEYSFSEECDDYCMQDCVTNAALFEFLFSKGYSTQCLRIEHRVAEIIFRQEQYGWFFDTAAAEKLTGELMARKVELEAECAAAFKPWYVRGPKMVGRNHKVNNTVKGADWTKITWKTFNPGSRDHIADRMTALYGWAPKEMTPEGKPKVDEVILGALPYPEAVKLTEYLTVTKRLGQLSDGKQSWIKAVRADGRIHGRVNSNGAVTGRMTHSNPNVANADKYPPMRACWTVPRGKKLVGCDADGLELRMLAHRMAKYDNGAYVKIVIEGTKAAGTDAHTLNMKALGLNYRDNAKTWIYAFLYGAGNYKLGTIVFDDFDDEKKARFNAQYPDGKARGRRITALGKTSRDKLAAGFPALAKLIEKIKAYAKRHGYLIGLDGRRIHVRSEHSALNSQLQSDGAVAMKQALIHMFDEYDARWPNGEVEPVGNIHDEVQQEVDEEIAHDVARIASESIVRAGVTLGLACPLAAGSDIGDNWSQTH